MKTVGRVVKLAVMVLIPGYLFIAPPFEGLNQAAMNYLAVFTLILFGMMLHIVSDYVVVILGLLLMVVLKVGTFSEVFGAFGDTSVWNLVGIFGFAAAISKTGLLNRIALHILKVFPDTFNGQLLSILVTGFVLGPLIPSVTAKMTILASLAVSLSQYNHFKKSSKGATALFLAM